MRTFTYLIFLLSIPFLACTSEEDTLPRGTQLLRNTDLSSNPNSIAPWNSIGSQGFNLGVSTEIFRSGSQSIFIENLDSLNINLGTWTQTYRGIIPNAGRRISLRAYLKGEDIRTFGPESNIYISMRMFPVEDDNGSTGGRFISSQSRVLVNGTFDWRPLEVSLNSIPPQVEFIVVYLVMGPRTTGKVFFDDITLTVD